MDSLPSICPECVSKRSISVVHITMTVMVAHIVDIHGAVIHFRLHSIGTALV